MINFGKYSEKVSFITFGQVSDGAGGFIPNQSVELITFARVIQSKGGNDIEALQMLLPKTYIIGVQWRSGFVPDESMQILYRNSTHKITGVSINDQRQRKEYIISMVQSKTSISELVIVQNTLDSSLDFTL